MKCSGGAAGPLGDQTPQAGASLEGKASAGLVERFLRAVHGFPTLFACTARLASELGAPWASDPRLRCVGGLDDGLPCTGHKTPSFESCAADRVSCMS